MAKSHPFYSLHRQGMIRAGVCTPATVVADPAANARATIELAKQGDAEGADLLVFPELNVTSYAIDDLHLQDAVLDATEAGIAAIAEASKALKPVLLVGAALRRNGRLYNCAVAVARGRILGVVPKQYLPNYREYYEKRWFASGIGLTGLEISVAGQTVPFGADLVFAASDLADFVFHIEVCEDYWAPVPPSTEGALAGALVLCNLSASNIVIGKGRERELYCAAQSARTASAYVYSASGPGESTTDLAWDGQGLIYELGELLAASERFELTTEIVYSDLDLE
ncbi:MAG TPA: nitrilase-related carbon-nitrogen hydrolase, partial [Sphingomonas sp.]|nr:nitrilase-related carbon-nitrogen hydrolase [Sphingomonas sp.]